MSRLLPLVAVSVLALALAAPKASAASCENLITLKVADTTIKSATSVDEGPFNDAANFACVADGQRASAAPARRT